MVKADRGYRSFADLRGRTVALNKGSNVHWLLVRLLEANNMTLKDIQVSTSSPRRAARVRRWAGRRLGDLGPVLRPGRATGVQVLADATGLASNREYVLAAPDAVAKRTDQVRAFLQQYREVTDWGIAHPEERASTLAPELKIPQDVTSRALARSARPSLPSTRPSGTSFRRSPTASSPWSSSRPGRHPLPGRQPVQRGVPVSRTTLVEAPRDVTAAPPVAPVVGDRPGGGGDW
ncbi:ABC transporter substrate-binding protein [Micromonospora sp. M12]